MTQMLLFDFATTAASPVPVTAPPVRRTSPKTTQVAAASPATGATLRRAVGRRPRRERVAVAGGSLPLYDPAEGELHQIGDLAQLVLARYEMVHRRRAARRRREAAQQCAG